MTHRLLPILLLALSCLFSARAAGEGGEAAPASTPEARIAGLKERLAEAQAARYRLRHRLQYEAPELRKLRLEASAWEKETMRLREALDQRLRALDASVRDDRRDVAGSYRAAAEQREFAAAIGREIALEERKPEDEARAGRLAVLRNDLAETLARAEAFTADAEALSEAAQTRQADLIAGDEEARLLKEDLDTAERELVAAEAALNQALDRHPEMIAQEQARLDLSAELQALLQNAPPPVE